MISPSENSQYNASSVDGNESPYCCRNDASLGLGTKPSPSLSLERIPSPQLNSIDVAGQAMKSVGKQKPSTVKTLGVDIDEEDSIEAKTRRRLRRRHRSNEEGNKEKPALKGILRTSSSFGAKASEDVTANLKVKPIKKRVSFPGLVSSRWDSQSSISQSLKSPTRPLRSKGQDKEARQNYVWNERKPHIKSSEGIRMVHHPDDLPAAVNNNSNVILASGTELQRPFKVEVMLRSSTSAPHLPDLQGPITMNPWKPMKALIATHSSAPLRPSKTQIVQQDTEQLQNPDAIPRGTALLL